MLIFENGHPRQVLARGEREQQKLAIGHEYENFMVNHGSLAEWSKARGSSSLPQQWAWVQIPQLSDAR